MTKELEEKIFDTICELEDHSPRDIVQIVVTANCTYKDVRTVIQKYDLDVKQYGFCR